MTTMLLIVCVTVVLVAAITARTVLQRDRARAQQQREIAMHDRAATAPIRDVEKAVEELGHQVQQLSAAAAALVTATEMVHTAQAQRAPSRIGQRVTVHTKKPADETFYGVVHADYTDRIVLEDAELVGVGGNTQLPGRPHIDRDDISWIDALEHVVPAAVEPSEVSTS